MGSNLEQSINITQWIAWVLLASKVQASAALDLKLKDAINNFMQI